MGQLVLLNPQCDQGRDVEEGGLIEFGDVCVRDLQAHGVPGGQRGGHHRDRAPVHSTWEALEQVHSLGQP